MVTEFLPDEADPRIIIDRAVWNVMAHMPEGVFETAAPKKWARMLAYFLPDIPFETIWGRIKQLRKYRAELMRLRAVPQVEQRSEEWFAMRRTRLTASDLAQSLDRGKFGTRDELLVKKINELEGNPMPFNANIPPLVFGVMFEPMAARSYQQRNQEITLHAFGLIAHPNLPCFGASPDDISELGIMLEYKCPFRRKIDGTIPEQYLLQIQGQLATANLQECSYVECGFRREYDEGAYAAMTDPEDVRDHGVIVEFSVSGARTYAYSPPYLTPVEAVAWAQDTFRARMKSDPLAEFTRYHYWKLEVYHCKRLTFDAEGWAELSKGIEGFWGQVQARKLPPPKPPKRARSGGSPKKKEATYEFLSDSEGEGG